jgi:hypothetical protein
MTATSPLSLDVFVLPYKPIVGLIAPMCKGKATWPATSVSLISGKRDAVLIDAAMTLGDETDHEKRMQWIASVEQIEAFDPKIVVAGLKRPDAQGDDPATILGDTKTYIRDFERSLSESHSPQELVDRMMVLHGDLGNPYTLWAAAQAVFEQGQEARAANPRMQEAKS